MGILHLAEPNDTVSPVRVLVIGVFLKKDRRESEFSNEGSGAATWWFETVPSRLTTLYVNCLLEQLTHSPRATPEGTDMTYVKL